MRHKIIVSLLFSALFCLMAQTVSAAPDQDATPTPFKFSIQNESATSPEAIVNFMTTFMKALPQFYATGQVSYDKVFQDNNKILYSFDFDYYVKRPGSFQLNLDGDEQNKQILFNGKTLTVYDADKAMYAMIESPSTLTIDEVLDKAKDYRLALALLDVGRSNFGDNLLKDVVKSAYVGLSSVGDILCHHVAFAKNDISYQLWIEEGDKPFLRKFAVTLKTNPAMPTWTAEITDWNLAPVLPEGWTEFVPKEGMKKIEFLKPSTQPVSAAK